MGGLSAAAVVAELLGAGVEVQAEGDRLRLREPRPGVLRPEHLAAVREIKPALHLVASGRWRGELATWPAWWRSRWAELVTAHEARGLAHETAEQIGFLEVAELPDELQPAEPPAAVTTAPCPACGVAGEVAVCGLGSCEECGWVPRFSWPWSGETAEETAALAAPSRPAEAFEGPPPPPATPSPVREAEPHQELEAEPEVLEHEDPEEATERTPPGSWVVHPCACGGCGAKALADRGLGACGRCGWQKPEGERFALAFRLATDEGLARRLEAEE